MTLRQKQNIKQTNLLIHLQETMSPEAENMGHPLHAQAASVGDKGNMATSW